MFWKFIVVFILFCISNDVNAQGLREKKPLTFDELILEANHISKSNAQYMKLDSLVSEVTSLKNKMDEKDSVIEWLKNNKQIVFKNTEVSNEQGYFVIVGAFSVKANALALTSKKSKYPVSIYRFQHSNLNYVGYKVNANQNLLEVLLHFRKYFVKDAWILKVSTSQQ
jgi:hypothetical protein